MSNKKKKELVELMESYKVPLIEDDVYSEIYFTKSRPITCKSFDKTGNVILCSSFSKNISPGLRVGWMIPGRYFSAVEHKKTLFQLGTSAIPQIALTYFLKEGGYDRHNRKLRTILKNQVSEMVDFILEHYPNGTQINPPKGGFVIWVQLPGNIDTMDIYNRVKHKEILFAPGIIFSISGKFKNCLRLNAGSWNQDVRDVIVEISRNIPADSET